MKVKRSILITLLCAILVISGMVTALAQNPNSCTTTGYSGYFYVAEYDAVTDRTTYHFTIFNRSPINGTFVNIGEIFLFDIAAPVSTLSPPGWEFKQIGPKLFWATTSNPWWKTPPAIKPADNLTGFHYTISGPPDTDFIMLTHVQQVTDASGTDNDDLDTWFDCSVFVQPVVDEPCISVIKTVDPVVVDPGEGVIYTIEICNCGNTTLTVTAVDDTVLGDLLNDFIAANGNSDELDIGECVSFNVAYQLLGTETSPFQNCVDVTGVSPNEDEVTDNDCADVIINQQQDGPCIEITKTADPIEGEVGEDITYTIEVCNCGNVTLEVTSLIDSLLGDILDEFYAANNDSYDIDAGDCVSFDVTRTLLISDQSPLFNCVDVTAEDEEENEVTDNACARVDIFRLPSARKCFLPVTFTQELWNEFCDPMNPTLPNFLHSRFPIAFKNFYFYGTLLKNTVAIGIPTKNTVMFQGTKFGLDMLCDFFPQVCTSDRLYTSYLNPPHLLAKDGLPMCNRLAGEALALTLNIGFNDMRLMPRTPGYDLEKFIITEGTLRGKTVGQALDTANKVLTGTPTCVFGLGKDLKWGYEHLADILWRINANYAFIDFDTYIDLGYLKPNRKFGKPDPAHAPRVP